MAGIQGQYENGYVGGNPVWKKITRSGRVVEHRVPIHAGPNLIAEYNAGVVASTPVQEYVYAGEIDSLVLIRRSDATKYGVTRNRQWSITALHDLTNGTIVERYACEITGRRTIYAANGTTVRSTSSFGNHFGYTNRRHDEESGLMYFRARYYNPLTGEFLSRDPLEFVDGMSMYRGFFALNSVDPTGLSLLLPDWIKKFRVIFVEGVARLPNGKTLIMRTWKHRGKSVGIDDLLAEDSKIDPERVARIRKNLPGLKIKNDHNAQPDFSDIALHKVQVKGMTGNHEHDRALAMAELTTMLTKEQYDELVNNPQDYVLHHSTTGEMQVLPANVHKAFAHTGPASFMRKGQELVDEGVNISYALFFRQAWTIFGTNLLMTLTQSTPIKLRSK